MICIGIDPGKSGAAVALRDGKMKICRFDKDTEQDVAKWLEAIDTAASWRGEKVFCFIETGFGTGTYIWFNYETPPAPGVPTRAFHLAKLAYNRLYWLSARGLL